MRSFSRRTLFENGLLTIGSTVAGTGIFSAIAASPALAATTSNSSSDAILVVLQLAGGNDGLHAVVPYTDAIYRQSRPTIAVDPTTVIKLNDKLGLNPYFAGLKPMLDSNQLAIITNVGYPQPNLSHFQSQYIWQTLDTTGAQGTSRTGWLGNYLHSVGANNAQPFEGLDNGTQVATAFMSPGISVPAIASTATFNITHKAGEDARTKTLLNLYQSFGQENGSGPFGGLLQNISQTTSSATKELAAAVTTYKPAVTYPKSNLASSLQVIATAITQKLGMRVGYASIGGFDTHANEVKTLETLYDEMGTSIAAFFADLKAQNADQKVILMTWSEFGRRVHENGSMGTDHGTASPMFVMGPGVAGGVYGDAPDLTHLDASGNLVFKTDFRSVYGTIIDKWLGGNSATVLNGTYPTLNFLH